MKDERYLAHLKNEKGDYHYLNDHLTEVGNLAATYLQAACPSLSETAKWAGLYHDLGKYRDQFQAYMKSEGKIESTKETHHAVYGAALAFKNAAETKDSTWIVVAFAILAHHGRLHKKTDLPARFEEYDAFACLPELVQKFEGEVCKRQQSISSDGFLDGTDTLKLEFAIRIIYSALIDADRTDTAAHTANWNLPRKVEFDPEILLEQINNARRKKLENATRNNADETLIKTRNEIFDDCIGAAEMQPGFFSLNVPTGGGKTLASMAFAVKHAMAHSKRRIIVVIPYLSIIEQNAREYREMFGDDVVIENHSSVKLPDNPDDRDDLDRLSMVTENWDSPIVITTSVQFIESLFANRNSRCRKLHNIANSVVIFDEIQTLPEKLLEPLFSVWRTLVKDYGVSFVFSSATIPAFRKSIGNFKNGLDNDEMTEIIQDADSVFRKLDRVNYEFSGLEKRKTWSEVAAEMAAERQVIAVVNTRKHAFDLWNEISRFDSDGLFHLSSAMCPEHRLLVIDQIKSRLAHGEKCRVVSTQLVEAGVDIDFPVLHRAIGPLDSIVQAAGRCNREGKLAKGRVIVFTPQDHKLPGGTYSIATDITVSILSGLNEKELGHNSSIFADYFSRIYARSQKGDEIQQFRRELNFPEVSKRARVIDQEGIGVIVPYGDAPSIINEIRMKNRNSESLIFGRSDLRRLQRFMVNLYPYDFDQLKILGQFQPLIEGKDIELYVLDAGSYHKALGVLRNEHPSQDFHISS